MEDLELSDSNLEPNNVESFLKDFNAKFGVSTTSLVEVLDICDALFSDLATSSVEGGSETKIGKLEKKLKKEKAKNLKLEEDIKNLNVQNSELQNAIESLEDEKQRSKDNYASIEQKLAITQKKLQESTNSVERSTNTRKSLQVALDSLSEMYNEQISEISGLSKQRNSLLQITQKQKCIIENFENVLQNALKNRQQPEERAVKIPENYIDSAEILSSICKSVSEVLPATILPELIKIRDNSEESVVNRVDALINVLCEHNKTLNDAINKAKQENEESKEQQKKCEQSVIDALSMFEEELSFMQKLATSTDIQNCLLYRPELGKPLILDEDGKSFLLKRCAQNAKFIQDTITNVRIEDVQAAIDCTEPNHVFELLSPNILSAKLKQFVDKMDGREDSTVRMLFDLFAAQSFSNDLLQNHCVEIRQRYDLMQKELNQSRQETEASNETVKKALKKLNRMKNADEKIRKSVSNHFEINPESSTEKIVKDALNTLSQSIENASQLSESFSEEQFNAKLDEKLNQEREQYVNEINELKTNIESLMRENSLMKKERESEKEEVQQIKSDFAVKQKSLDDLMKTYTEQSNELTKQVKVLTQQNETLRLDGKKDKEELEQTKADIISLTTEYKKLKTECEKGKQKKAELKQKIDFLESTNRKVAQSLKEKSQELRREYETAIQDMNSKVVQARLELESTQDSYRGLLAKNEESEELITTLQVAKNQLELKLKSLEDKNNQEKSTLHAQLEAQLHSLVAQSRERIGTMEEEAKALVLSYSKKFERFGVKTASTGLPEFMTSLEDEMERRYKAQTVYEETVADLTKVQHLLSLLPSSNIFDAVHKLFKEKEILENQHKLDVENAKRVTDITEEKRNEQRKVEAQLESLRKWEEWARVLHRVVCERTSSTYSSDKLRLSLEEAILAAASHRTILNRLDSLREQKKALLKIDNEVLNEPLRTKQGWLPLISLCISCRRMQKQAGVVNIISQTPSTIELSASFDSKLSLSRSQSDENSVKYPPLFTTL